MTKEDIGISIMYKDFYMTGWSCRDVTADDVKLMPIIGGRGKQCRGGDLSHMTTPIFFETPSPSRNFCFLSLPTQC